MAHDVDAYMYNLKYLISQRMDRNFQTYMHQFVVNRWQHDSSAHDDEFHYSDVIVGVIASQATSLAVVYSTVYSGADQRKHQSSASMAFVRGIHRWPVNSSHKGPVTRKMFLISWRNHDFNVYATCFIHHRSILILRNTGGLYHVQVDTLIR